MIQDLSKGYIGRAKSGLIWPWTKAGWCSIRAAKCLNNLPIGTKADHKEKWNVNMYNHTLKIFKMWCLPQQWTELVKMDPVNVVYQGKQRFKHCKYFRNRSRSQNFVVQCDSEMKNFEKRIEIRKTHHPLTLLFTFLFTGKTDVWGKTERKHIGPDTVTSPTNIEDFLCD